MVERIVGLPGLANVTPSRGTPTVAQANPSSGAAIASAFDSVAQGARDVNRALQPVFDQRAQDEAIEAADAARAESEETGALVTPELRRAFSRQDQIYNQTLTQLTTARTMNDAREAFETMRREYRNEPEAFDRAVTAWRDAYISQLDTPYRVQLEAAVDRMSLDYGLRIQDERRALDARRAVEQTQSFVNDAQDRISRGLRDDPEFATSEEYQELRAGILESLEGLHQNPQIEGWYENDTALREAVESLEFTEERALAFNEIQGLIDAGDFDAAYERAEAIPAELGYNEQETRQFVGATFADINRTRVRIERDEAEARRIENEQAVAQRREQGTRYNQLVREMATGDASLQDFTAAWENGEISDDDYTRIFVNQASEAQEQADLLAYLRSGNPLDPSNRDHQRAVDLAYNAALAQSGGDGQSVYPERDRDTIMAVVDQYGIVPESGESSLRAGAFSEDPMRAIPALDTISALNRANPRAAGAAFSDDLLGEANVYSTMVANGASPEEAIQSVMGSRQMLNDDVRQMRRRTAEQHFRDNVTANTVADIFSKDDDFWERNPQLSEEAAAPALSAYQSLYAEAYERFGNADAAQAYAEGAIRRTYGITRMFGGRPQIMRHPPPAQYSQMGDRGAWMGQQLISTVAEESGIEANNLQGRVQLVSDYETSVDVGAGRAPTYRVVYQDENGVMQFMRDRFQFDPSDMMSELEQSARELGISVEALARSRHEIAIGRVAEDSEVLSERAIRDFLVTDTGGGQQALSSYNAWRRENPDAHPADFPGLPPTLFR